MASQLKKKFIGNDQVDSTKILLEQGQAIRAKDSAGVEQELIRFDGSDKVLVNGEEAALKSQVDAEQSARIAADDAIDSRLDIIEGADTVVGSIAKAQKDAQDYADAKVAALVDSAPALLDTLNELAAALGDDPNFVTTVTNLVAGVQSDIDQEILDRVAGDASTLSSANSYTDAEQSRAEAAEAAIADDVSHLVTLSGVSVDSDNLGSFSGSVIQDNRTIKQALQDLETELESVSGGTQSELDATQVGAGLNSDGSYSAPVGSNYLSSATSLKSADSELDSAIKTVADGLAQEIIDRAADVDAEQSRAEGVEASLQSQITQEIADRIADVDAEESRAMGIEASLQSQITQEISDRQADVDAEEAARIAADDALDARVDVLESVVWFKEKFSISNGQTSVTLSHTPEDKSISAWVDRLAIHEGASEDFTVSGTTMTFLNDIVSPGQSQLGNGDTVYVKYQYKI